MKFLLTNPKLFPNLNKLIKNNKTFYIKESNNQSEIYDKKCWFIILEKRYSDLLIDGTFTLNINTSFFKKK